MPVFTSNSEAPLAAPAAALPDRLGRTEQIHERRLLLLKWLDDEQWETCMMLGGGDASHHSGDLTWMVRKKLAERKRFRVGVSSGHWRYRRLDAGRQWLAARGVRLKPATPSPGS